jgi:hypothetical protein
MVSSILVRGVVVGLGAVVAVVAGPSLGLDAPWPLLLVLGVAFAPRTSRGAIGAVAVGAIAWWIAIALRAAAVPDTTTGTILASLGAVAVVTIVALATRDRVPLWAALVGIGAFAGVYEPQFAANPTFFLRESPLAMASVLIAVGVAGLAAVLADVVERQVIRRPEVRPRHAEVAS